jgi:hypothetical protein
MYKWLREIHLIAGLLALPMLLMYGVSAVELSHPQLFRSAPVTRSFTVDVGAASDPDAILDDLSARAGIEGEVLDIRRQGDSLHLTLERLATRYEIVLDATGKARVEERTGGVMHLLNRIHHVAGVWHRVGVIDLWGVWVIVASLALGGVAVTGVWMWTRRPAERRLGLIFVVASLTYAGTLLVLIRLA